MASSKDTKKLAADDKDLTDILEEIEPVQMNRWVERQNDEHLINYDLANFKKALKLTYEKLKEPTSIKKGLGQGFSNLISRKAVGLMGEGGGSTQE